jgi:RimJ/RimL family protein N-acetyltransferase
VARLAAVSHWPHPSPTAASLQRPAGPTLPLQNEKLLIRPLERPDLDSRQRWPPFRDPLHLIWDMPRCSQRENDGWFAQMNDGRHRLAYGVDDPAGHLIGMISLREVNWERSARLGISFSSQHVGRGYGTAAMRLFLPYFFVTLGFDQMLLDVAAANLRAVGCYQKLGFRRTVTHWQTVDGSLSPRLFDEPAYAALRSFFRWSWDRTEALYYDMELCRTDWEEACRRGALAP